MRRLALLAGIVALLASGCGGGETDSPSSVEPEPTAATDSVATPALTSETSGHTRQRQRPRPPTTAERHRVTTIASRLDRAVQHFDRSVSACSGVNRGSCIDRAWAVIVTDAE